MNTYFLSLVQKPRLERKRDIALEFVIDVAPNKFTPNFILEKYPQIRNFDFIQNKYTNQKYHWENDQYIPGILSWKFSIGSTLESNPLYFYYYFQHSVDDALKIGPYL